MNGKRAKAIRRAAKQDDNYQLKTGYQHRVRADGTETVYNDPRTLKGIIRDRAYALVSGLPYSAQGIQWAPRKGENHRKWYRQNGRLVRRARPA